MPMLDPIAVRVTRRYLAQLTAERRAREVQRRPEGLVTVTEDEEDTDERDAQGRQPCARPENRDPSSVRSRPCSWWRALAKRRIR